MADQPDTSLEASYRRAAEAARRYLASRFSLRSCAHPEADFPGEPDDWREVWRVTDRTRPDAPELLVAVPWTFPDTLPIAYLPKAEVARFGTIPHLSRKRLLCTFDAEVVRPDVSQPGAVAEAVVRQALAERDAGSAGTNTGDYRDEFVAYWNEECDVRALSLVDQRGPCRTIAQLTLSPAWKDRFRWVFAESASEGADWLRRVGWPGRISPTPAIFLPLPDLGDPPFPQTNGELVARLRQAAPQALAELLDRLPEMPRPSTVLFAVPLASGTAVGAWQHPLYTYQGHTGPRSRTVKGLVPGFRENRHPAILELDGQNRKGLLLKAAVERADTARLVRRAGAGDADKAITGPVTIIGCGSVGSFIAEALARSGQVSALRLIDPEVLAVENVLRHVCGMEDIGEQKVEALKRSIERRFPHVSCTVHAEDVLDLLRREPSILVPSALTVVAVGSWTVEQRLNGLMLTKPEFPSPICFAWVEPFCAGGHAVFLSHGTPGCLNCAFDRDGHFAGRIVDNPAQFVRREAGCQTSFTPYGGQDTVVFASAVGRFLLNAPESSRLFSWIGDPEASRTRGVRLTETWRDAQAYSTRCAEISARQDCPVCQP